MMSVSQIIMLYTLNLYSVICQWYLDKVVKKHEKNKCVCVYIYIILKKKGFIKNVQVQF